MTDHDGPADDPRRGPTLSRQDARQGEIILRSRTRRWIFFGALAACVPSPLERLQNRTDHALPKPANSRAPYRDPDSGLPVAPDRYKLKRYPVDSRLSPPQLIGASASECHWPGGARQVGH